MQSPVAVMTLRQLAGTGSGARRMARTSSVRAADGAHRDLRDRRGLDGREHDSTTCSGRRLPTISSVAFAALSSGALVATVVDIRVRRIPNALTATMAGVGIGLAASGVERHLPGRIGGRLHPRLRA